MKPITISAFSWLISMAVMDFIGAGLAGKVLVSSHSPVIGLFLSASGFATIGWAVYRLLRHGISE